MSYRKVGTMRTPVKLSPLITEHDEEGNVASIILLCDPVATQQCIIPDEGDVAGEWSIMFSVNDDSALYPAKFWMSENYQEMAGLNNLQGIFTIDDWLYQIAEEDRENMKKHMLSLMTTNDSSSMITYKMNTGDNDMKRVFSMATAIVDERNGNLHVKAVDWFIPDKQEYNTRYLFEASSQLNNQLLAIQGWTDLMAFNSSDLYDMKEYVERISNSVNRAAEKTHDIILHISGNPK